MKKFLYSGFCLLIIVCLALLAGCTQSEGITSSTPNVTSAAAHAAAQQPAVTTGADPASLVNLSAMLDIVEHSVLQIDVTSATTNSFGLQSQSQGAGSGWAIDSNGTIITCQHVIEGATTITATTIDGKTYPAKLVNADPIADVAVLKINATNIPALKVVDTSKLRVGDWVLTVGNPLGEGISAKQGIISRLGVDIPFSSTQTYPNMIEVSAAINPGNSGGPLINLSGEVIGITTIKVSDVGIEGMGYATNMSDAAPVIQKLSAK